MDPRHIPWIEHQEMRNCLVYLFFPVYTSSFYNLKDQVLKPQIPDVNQVVPLRSGFTAVKWESATQQGIYF